MKRNIIVVDNSLHIMLFSAMGGAGIVRGLSDVASGKLAEGIFQLSLVSLLALCAVRLAKQHKDQARSLCQHTIDN